MAALVDPNEWVLYAAINRGLVALRRGDWALADTIARGLTPRMDKEEPNRPDAAAIARFKKEIKASGRPI